MKEIKLKEIKPKTAIHCTDKEQIECLIKNNIVGNWALERGIPIWLIAHTENKVVNSWMPEIKSNGRTGKKYCKKHGYTCVEFSDLILPETMTEEEAYKKGREDAFKEVKNCEAYGYDCGLKDAWELVKKIALNTYDGGIDAKKLEAIFGTHDSYTIFKENDVKDALAKLEAYQEEIKVGDVVEREVMGIFVVVNVNTDTDCYTLMNKDGRVTCASKKQISKTGKHIDLSAILAKIGKE